MNQPIPTGPDLFGFGEAAYSKAQQAGQRNGNRMFGSDEEIYQFNAAEHYDRQANTAALVMLTEVIARIAGTSHPDLDAWREKIGMSWLKECRSKEDRRPQCAEWHTEDCPYSDPMIPVGTRVIFLPRPAGGNAQGEVKEQKRLASGKYRLRVQWDGAELSWVDQTDVIAITHTELPVGTRVLVSDSMTRHEYTVELDGQPWTGKIIGNATNGCYKIAREYGDGYYGEEHPSYVFKDERVRIHPDGPACPLPPEPVKQEPTGPRMYVRNRKFKQGHIVAMRAREGFLMAQVQWYVPGTVPVWTHMSDLIIIGADEVERCPNGQTGDECGSGENQCELCLAAEDEEGDMIEESMGLR